MSRDIASAPWADFVSRHVMPGDTLLYLVTQGRVPLLVLRRGSRGLVF